MQNFVISETTEAALMDRQGRIHAYEGFDPGRTALVVVDMQNYFMADGEPACCLPAREIVPNVNRLAAAVRAGEGLVVWIQTEAKPDTPDVWWNLYEIYTNERGARRQERLAKDGSGFPLWSELDVKEGDEIIIKTRYSAFIQGASNLEEALRSREIETILIAGVATNVCCESTARDGMMRGFRTLMVSDGNASFTEAAHANALQGFIGTFGDVQTTDEIIKHLSESATRPAAAE